MKNGYIIDVKNLYKKFSIGAPKNLANAIPFFLSTKNKQEFWALKGLNLQIKRGEKIGIIGPNGSGKTTLLQVLAGITTPTKGTVIVDGKVASLLGVGAGFHPDLTGKENIFLYGSILGMSSREIRNKYDEIVDFSGVKKFLDTPVKHYSSGMFIRLAFSVAVFLEWDILLLDEVLAVGDAEFQKKSIAKMEEIINTGKTFLFVTHDLSSIRKLCQRAILLKNGRIVREGKATDVLEFYERSFSL